MTWTDSCLTVAESNATCPAGQRPVSHVRKLLFSAVTVGAVLLLLEAGARVVSPGTQNQRFRQINQIVMFLGTQPSDLMLDFDSERFWKLKPNITINDPDNTFWQGTVSNAQGFRCSDFDLKKTPGTLRIVCFGDSSTFGIGARMEDTWAGSAATAAGRRNCQGKFNLSGHPRCTASGSDQRGRTRIHIASGCAAHATEPGRS